MNTTASTNTAAIAEIQEALRRGDVVGAKARLATTPDAPPLLAARIANLGGDLHAEEQALTRALEQNPRHLGALLAMADTKVRQHDDRAAAGWFRAALNQASSSPFPADFRPLLERAQSWLDQSSQRFEAHIRSSLGDVGKMPRIGHAIDLLTNKVQLYLQQPSMFYFPGLPQRPFYERAEFPWLAEVEAAIPTMQAELAVRLSGGADFRPYVETQPGRPAPNNPLKDDPAWGAHYFWNNGEPVEPNASEAPATMAALAKAPIPVIKGRSPMALWSLLKPGTHIQPHHGMLNTRLICHIPLVVNADCAIRVGPETRTWEPGKALIFDDSFEHEAWNRGTETRVILLFEIWRPEITAEEREGLTRLFETIDLLGPAEGGNGF